MSEPISSRINKPTLEKVDSYAEEMRYNRSQAVRVILEDWAKAQSEEQLPDRKPSEQGEVCT